MGRRAVILAGGKGSRLGPYTTVLPKPLLPVGDRAILDVVVHQLRDAGFDDLTLAVGYLSHLVRAVMGDGSTHGVSIDYHEELEPLGTVGPLATIDRLDESFLMMNGDVLTALDYAHLVDVHKESGNLLTIASHRRVVRTEYGVLHLDGNAGDTRVVTGFEEKPELPYIVSMGVYVIEPARPRVRRGRPAAGPARAGDAPARGRRPGGRVHLRRLLARHRTTRGLREGDHGIRAGQAPPDGRAPEDRPRGLPGQPSLRPRAEPSCRTPPRPTRSPDDGHRSPAEPDT